MRIHWWLFIISRKVLKRWYFFTPVFNSCTWSIKKAFLFTLFVYVRYSSYRKDTLMLDSFPMFNSFQSKLTLTKAINESLGFLFENIFMSSWIIKYFICLNLFHLLFSSWPKCSVFGQWQLMSPFDPMSFIDRPTFFFF